MAFPHSSAGADDDGAPSTPAPARPVEVSTADLVQRAIAGQRWAETALYERHASSVIAVATRLLGRNADAEDVAQDSFIMAFARLSQLREPQHFRAWLLRIAVQHVHRIFRKRKLLRALGMDRGQDDASLAKQALSGADAETQAELGKLDAVLASLPSKERIVWMLRHVEGYDLQEVADASDASLASVKRWIAKADERVRAHVRFEVGS